MKKRLIAVVAGLAAVGAAYAYRAPITEAYAVEARRFRLADATTDPNAILIVGDSIVDRSAPESLCGRPVINAGLSGSGVREWLSEDVGFPARTAVVALGLNDARAETNVHQWRADYEALIDRLGKDRIVLVQIMPFEAADFSEPVRLSLNREIQAVGEERHLRVIAPLPSAQGLTMDGLHFNSRGTSAWRAQIESLCH